MKSGVTSKGKYVEILMIVLSVVANYGQRSKHEADR